MSTFTYVKRSSIKCTVCLRWGPYDGGKTTFMKTSQRGILSLGRRVRAYRSHHSSRTKIPTNLSKRCRYSVRFSNPQCDPYSLFNGTNPSCYPTPTSLFRIPWRSLLRVSHRTRYYPLPPKRLVLRSEGAPLGHVHVMGQTRGVHENSNETK